MKLYHGTTADNLENILKNGIQPRFFTKKESNWEGPIASRENLVYLTDAYPVYYAMTALKGEEDLLIIEVEVDEQDLYPDEDYIGYLITHAHKINRIEAIKSVNPLDHKEFYKDSLEFNGVASCLGINKKQILRYITIPGHQTDIILQTGGDASPTPFNYKILKEYYRSAVQALFRNSNYELLMEELSELWQLRRY